MVESSGGSAASNALSGVVTTGGALATARPAAMLGNATSMIGERTRMHWIEAADPASETNDLTMPD